MTAKLLGVACAMLASAAFGYDWPPAGSEVTIGPDETVTVAAGEIDAVNALSKLTVNGTLKFDCAKPPTCPMAGTGVCEKLSADRWEMKTANQGYLGKWYVRNGVVAPSVRYCFGGETKLTAADIDATAVYICDGATMELSTLCTSMFGDYTTVRRIHFAGTGYPGTGGALVVNLSQATGSNATTIFRRTILDGDTTIFSSDTDSNKYFWSKSVWDLNGYELTFAGLGRCLVPSSEGILSNGTIRVKSVAGGSHEFQARHGSTFRAPGTIKLESGTSFLYREDGGKTPFSSNPIGFCLDVTGSATFRVDENGANKYVGPSDKSVLKQTGGIVLNAGSSLNVYLDESYYSQLHLTGPISGAGSIRNDYRSGGGRIRYGANDNAQHTGGWYFCMTNGTVVIDGKDVVHDYGAVTNYGTSVALRVDDEGVNWPFSSICSFARGGVWGQGALLSIDPDGLASREYAIDGAAWMADGARAGVPLAVDSETGAGKLVVSSTGSETALNLASYGGTLTVTGDTQMTVGDTLVGATRGDPDRKAKLEFVGAHDVRWTTQTKLVCGSQENSGRTDCLGELRFADTAVSAPEIPFSKDANLASCIYLAPEGRAVMKIEDGAVISNRLYCGSYAGGGQVLIHQTGGEFVNLGTAGYQAWGAGIGHLGSTYFRLDGGTFRDVNSTLAGRYDPVSIDINGGTYRRVKTSSNSEETWALGAGNNKALLRVRNGGQVVSSGSHLYAAGFEGNAMTVIAVEDAGSVLNLNSKRIYTSRSAVAVQTHVCLNDGGLMSVAAFSQGKNNTADVRYLNFDGGIHECGTDYEVYGNDSSAYWQNFRVTVYGRGATLRVPSGKTPKVYQTIRRASGGGISQAAGAIPLPAAVLAYDSLVPPMVRITGDGQGALACVEFDMATRKPTGVKVLCPGFGYKDTAQAEFIYCEIVKGKYTSAVVATVDCPIVANDETGDFTKDGAGTLELYRPNEWGGKTVVAGGTVKACCDFALPQNTSVQLRGGATLDLNSTSNEIASVECGVGLGTIVNAGNAKVPAVSGYVIDVAELKAGKSIEIPGGANLDGLTVTVTGDLAELVSADARRYTLIKAKNGVVTGMPAIVSGDVPEGWSFRMSGGKLSFARDCGMMLLVR